ncbi:MAG: protein-L-isoaspartate(D-aspartate) O-methyltransferase, partial [Gemmatimonadota bacterium]
HDQTISQPYIVARMTELLELEPGEKVLEVGTGSGYQAAVLAEITDSVYTIEIIEDLARSARERLRRLGYDDVVVRHGDGYEGWPEHAPFDAIVVTAAPEEIPPPLIEQLARGGRMVIPRGPRGGPQVLLQVRKTPEGEIEREAVSGVRFVPFLRDTADVRRREQR